MGKFYRNLIEQLFDAFQLAAVGFPVKNGWGSELCLLLFW